MAKYGLTETGFIKKPYTVCLQENVDIYKIRYTKFLEHDSNMLYMQCKLRAHMEENMWNVAEAMYNAMFINSATGKALDERLSDLIGPRHAAQYSVGVVSITGLEGVSIEVGETLKRDDSTNYIYRVLYAKTIPIGGKVDVTVQCTTAGAGGNAPSKTITAFTKTKTGIKDVQNVNPVLGGSERESDDAYRMRYYVSLQDLRGSNVPAIKARLAQVTGVTAYRVLENKAAVEATVSGVLMPPHSIWTSVVGGADEDIAKALFYTKAGGINDSGTTSFKFDDEGQSYTIAFNRGVGIIVYVGITLTVAGSFDDADMEVIKANIKNYIDVIPVAEPLLYLDLVSKALGCVQGVSRIDVKIGRSAGALGTADIVPGPNEKVATELQYITVSRKG